MISPPLLYTPTNVSSSPTMPHCANRFFFAWDIRYSSRIDIQLETPNPWFTRIGSFNLIALTLGCGGGSHYNVFMWSH